MADISIEVRDEVFLNVYAETSTLYELQDVFTFYADGFKYNPKYKAKLWDGKLRMLRILSKNKGQIYRGLYEQIIAFCKDRDYTYQTKGIINQKNKISETQIKEFINELKLHSKGNNIEPRDYQLAGFVDAIENKRTLLLSPTSSGKSLMIYMVCRYLIQNGLKGLIIVPSIGLVHQMAADFADYATLVDWDSQEHVHKLFEGQAKQTDKPILISTFQSLNTIKTDSFFEEFDFVITDEVHQAKANSKSGSKTRQKNETSVGAIVKILEKCINAEYRIGLTGTLDKIKLNEKTLIGLFGPVNKLTTTKELMERNEVSNLKILCLLLKYDEEICKLFRRNKVKYQDEIRYLVSNKKRNQFIKNLALSLDKNSIILFNYVETHGKVIYELIKNSKHLGDRNVYFIHGGVEGEERERIRNIMEHEKNAIIVGSSSILSTGISIKNLHNIIFAISGKSRIRTLQSIGRILRLHESKDVATLYDICDDLSIGKYRNFTLEHFLERVSIYNKEQFDYKLKKIEFKCELH